MDQPLLVVALLLAAMGLLSAWIAAQRGRSTVEGLILGCLFGPLGVLVECLLPVPEKKQSRPASRRTTNQATTPIVSVDEDNHPAVAEFLAESDPSHNRERKISRRP